ncbi:3'-5' poly(A) RNA exonuclease KNAG_0G03470 [Huiozyma naganishii CBS 8797]|uniref:Endonuclease/exonuclease/phosphatase domain-containing protein n=1 Tax=Huiozyma naganishii (strain ATCC MYA-139 / BCRC 22969 / CBS 8797 / KCTC 17520 / NBRC 10181 / NCYC 3082 / Yp74L-3) TaxID=1071383 RepID=J7R957_HUIN7|nr:hypothetical protein KNAG_0G03470 [Kazachstania naganishii CBS 8797]CCK71405.1 hypothetical protein KNAG_0G03470 [Kazachstania naganishii CBS 8797]
MVQKTKLPRSEITPEYIERIRALRREKREREKAERADVAREIFIKRPLLEVPYVGGVPCRDGYVRVKIMTYNTLAQTLIRRTTFPDAKDAIKWHRRSQVLIQELEYYDADVVCLQETDRIQWDKFWVEEFDRLGYKGGFFNFPGKVHGVAIVWKTSMFEDTPLDKLPLCLDDYVAGDDIAATTGTRTVALAVALRLKHHKTSRPIIFSTTHLFWHLFGTFERTRQLFVILSELNKFIKKVTDAHCPRGQRCYTFFTGDFNSQPCDAPYLSLTDKPVQLKGRAKSIIECSLSYRYSKRRNSILEDDEDSMVREPSDQESVEDETNRPQDPRPYTYDAMPEQVERVQHLQNLHNCIPLQGVSLYGIGYHLVHPENSNKYSTSVNQEPQLSHRALHWSGLLDYIFLITEWSENATKISDLQALERQTGIKINGYLRMPLKEEMCDHTEPHENEYPSDHLAMMCDISLPL